MCLSPLHIANRALFSHYAVTSPMIDVPCGRCDACRDERKTSWEDRLCLEVSEWYRLGGVGLMLTFTYNNDCLPHFCRDGYSVACFSSTDITTFLSRLKTRCSRVFGKGFYRYFICSEYGSDTNRPHYHVIFLIRDIKFYVQFVEICRDLWCWIYKRDRKGHFRPSCRLGYMFPKRKNGLYVDDLGRDKSPLFRSQLAGAKYVCKYVCKDLSFYDLPSVKYFQKKYFTDFASCLPKSWKSKNLGFAAVDRIVSTGDDVAIRKLLKDGVWSPLQKKYVPLWPSAVARLMYNNVFKGRVNKITGNKLYDRELSSFGRSWLWFTFKNRVERTCPKIYERMCLLQNDSSLSSRFPLKVPKLFVSSDFKNYALWHCLFKSLSVPQLNSLYGVLGSNLHAFFDIDNWQDFYILRHDSVGLRHCSFPVCDTSLFPADVYDLYSRFESVYSDLCIYLQKGQLLKYQIRGESIHKAKVIQGAFGFPRNLC